MDNWMGAGWIENGIWTLGVADMELRIPHENMSEAQKEQMYNAYRDGDHSDKVVDVVNQMF